MFRQSVRRATKGTDISHGISHCMPAVLVAAIRLMLWCMCAGVHVQAVSQEGHEGGHHQAGAGAGLACRHSHPAEAVCTDWHRGATAG